MVCRKLTMTTCSQPMSRLEVRCCHLTTLYTVHVKVWGLSAFDVVKCATDAFLMYLTAERMEICLPERGDGGRDP